MAGDRKAALPTETPPSIFSAATPLPSRLGGHSIIEFDEGEAEKDALRAIKSLYTNLKKAPLFPVRGFRVAGHKGPIIPAGN